MANKVISIKMDEKDIEKLKDYYNALVKLGFVSAKTMSLNAFYKHLLLDYLEDDVCRAFDSYSEFGIKPRCLNPNYNGDNRHSTLANTYNLSDEMFKCYVACVKEASVKWVEELNEGADTLNRLIKSAVVPMEDFWYTLEYFPEEVDMKSSFWMNKANETVEYQDNDFKENGINGEIQMIENSSLSDDLKQKLIEELREYERKRRQNYNFTRGMRQ